jgi:MFS family permease
VTTSTTETPEKFSSFTAWRVCLSAALFFYYTFIQLNLIDAINAPLARDFHVHATALSTLSAMFFWGNFLTVIPAGILLDRFSTKKLLLIAIFISTLGTAMFAISPIFLVACVCRFFVGVAGGFCFLGPMRLASRWFPTERLAFVTGVIVTIAMLGGITAQTPVLLLANHIGWHNTVLLDALLGVSILIIVALFVRDNPPLQAAKIKHGLSTLQKIGLGESLRLVFKNYQNWLSALYASLLNLPVFLLGAIWGIPYLTQAKGFSMTEASLTVSTLFLGMVVGSPLFGWLSDFLGVRKAPMLFGAITSLIVILILIYHHNLSLPMTVGLFFCIGFFNSTQSLAYPLVAESNPSALTGTAVGIVSCTLMLSGALAQPVFGYLMERHWDHTVIQGMEKYSINDFHLAILMVPISFVITIFIATILRETHCHNLSKDF